MDLNQCLKNDTNTGIYYLTVSVSEVRLTIDKGMYQSHTRH